MAYRVDVKVEEKARLKGHRWQLSDLEFNVDGTVLASASWDKEVRLWDLFTLDTVCVLKDQHTVPVTTVSWFPPDGSLIVTGSADNTACLWSADAGEMLVCLKEHFGWIMDSSFSQNGAALATASWDKTVRVWDPATGGLLTTLNGHTKGVYGCHYHPSATSNVICSASEDETVRIWDTRMQGHKPVKTMIGGHDDAVLCCRWSPDGMLVATGGADQTVTVWDAREGRVLVQLREHADAVKKVEFHPGTGPWNGKTILASAGDTSCCLWDPTELAERDLLCRHVSHGGKELEAIAFTPDGTVLATGGRDNDIALSFLSCPGMASNEGELAWVKHQSQETARQEALVVAEREAEECERQREQDEMYGEDSEETTEEESSDDGETGRDAEAGGDESMHKWSANDEVPVEVQRRQLRHRTPGSRYSSAMMMSQLRRISIHGDGLTSPRVLRSTLSAASSVDKERDLAWGLRQHRLLPLATELSSAVSYLGDAVTEHCEAGREDEEEPATPEQTAVPLIMDDNESLILGLEHGADEKEEGDAVSVVSDLDGFAVIAISGVTPRAGGAATSSAYGQTKMMSLGRLPNSTPSLAVSMPPSRTNSIHNFFAEEDPMPDLAIAQVEALNELDLAIPEDDDDDEEVEVDVVYGEQPVQYTYTAEPMRPPSEYLARMSAGYASTPGAGGPGQTDSTSPLSPRSPDPQGTLPRGGGPPATQRRPTYTFHKSGAKKPLKATNNGGSSGSGYEDLEEEDEDADGENYEPVEEATVADSKPQNMAAAKPLMSARNDSGISGISTNRSSVHSTASNASNTSKLATVTSDSGALKSLLRMSAAASGVGAGGDLSAGSAQGSPQQSRQPSVKSRTSTAGSSNIYAGRRLPELPPPGATAGSSGQLSPPPSNPLSSGSPSPISSPSSPPHPPGPRPPPSAGRPRSAENSPRSGESGSSATNPRQQTMSKRSPAGLPPSGPSGRPPLAKVPFLDGLVEEERIKARSAPNSPVMSARNSLEQPTTPQPPRTARRPTRTFTDGKPSTAKRPAGLPVSPMTTANPVATGPEPAREEERKRKANAQAALANAMSVDGDNDSDDEAEVQDDYMMFEGNDTSVI